VAAQRQPHSHPRALIAQSSTKQSRSAGTAAGAGGGELTELKFLSRRKEKEKEKGSSGSGSSGAYVSPSKAVWQNTAQLERWHARLRFERDLLADVASYVAAHTATVKSVQTRVLSAQDQWKAQRAAFHSTGLAALPDGMIPSPGTASCVLSEAGGGVVLSVPSPLLPCAGSSEKQSALAQLKKRKREYALCCRSRSSTSSGRSLAPPWRWRASLR
jgi:hypothetical protein